MLADTVVPGRITVEWLEGWRFLLHRARNDHPDFPDSISVIGETEEGADSLTMHYFGRAACSASTGSARRRAR
jgi:hypothetical protein